MADKSRLTKRVETFEKQWTSCKNILMHYADDKGPETIKKTINQSDVVRSTVSCMKNEF